MQAELEITTTETNSPQSRIQSKIPEPRFVVCEMLEWDDTDWQDFLSQHADTGVRP